MNPVVPDPTPEPIDSKTVFRRLLSYSAPHWRVFLIALVAMIVFAGTESSVAYLIKPLTDGSFIQRDPQVIRWIPFQILGLFLLRASANFTSSYAMASVGQRVVSRLRCEVFEHLLRVPVTHHDRARNADLQAKLTYHASQVADSASSVLTSIVRDGMTALGLLSYMLYTSWKLTLFALLMAPVLSASVTAINRRFRSVSSQIQNSMSGITHSADEAITGRRVLKVYGGESFALASFRKIDDYLRRQSLKMTATSQASQGSLDLIAAFGVASLVYIATLPGMLETMTPGTFVSFIGAMLMMRQPISNMSGLSERFQRGLVAGADLFAFIDTPSEPDHGQLALPQAVGNLRFENLHFRYSDDAAPALNGVSLEVKAGSTVAFVGKSGSGKSTLLSLLPRFYEPQSGRIVLDGHDLRDYKLEDLRRQIALVDQNVVLFNATIAENIAYGDPAATPAKLEAAARDAYAWDFIARQPQGLDSPIGADGLMLSGGQRQRISIARALYKNAPILILDEATSALDTESERYIQDALETLKRGRTTLVIAHRLSTIQDADLIVVMREGRVVEHGRHEELLARDGEYAMLHRMQFREDGAEGEIGSAPAALPAHEGEIGQG